jgi:exosortase
MPEAMARDTKLNNRMSHEHTIKIVVLAGGRDFGRCPLASQLPTALWPVAGKPVLERLLTFLASQEIKQVTVFAAGGTSLSLQQSIHIDSRLNVKFLEESLPVGTAGCIRDAAGDETDALFLVVPAAIISPPRIEILLEAHRKGGCDLTVMLNPGRKDGQHPGEACGIYACNAAILEHIPKDGYFDIKEGLIPEMLRRGKSVYAAVLPHNAGNFRDWQEYLRGIASFLETNTKPDPDLKLSAHPDRRAVWTAASSKIDKGARIFGPTVIMDNAAISSGAVIIGPTILENNVTIRENTVVAGSVIWNGAKIGPDCELQRCVVDRGATVRGGTTVQENAILRQRRRGGLESAARFAKAQSDRLQHAMQPHLDKLNERLPDWAVSNKKNILTIIAGVLVLSAFLWSYWPGIVDLWEIWQRNDEYSSGLLVPFLTIYILWSRRQDIARCPIRPCVWGVPAFIGAQAVRLFGLFFMYGSAERLSIALSIAALVLLLFGPRLFRKVATVILFLCLMLPWPNQVQAAVALPLQRWATSSAVFCLETMGYEVMKEGNIIHIGQSSVAVAEACNGLRMVTAFFVISGLVVLLVKRPLWEKLVILASSLPIALLCNTIRLTITALAFTVISGEQWEKIFHDFGGYAMMPLALAAIVGELWIMTKLTIAPTRQESIIVTRQKAD